MTEIINEMVDTVDRLLLLLTGPHAVTDPEHKEAALEAFGLLTRLESWLSTKDSFPQLHEQALANLQHRIEVLEHINRVILVLQERGYL